MKIVALSDTHNKHKKLTLPEGDVLVHAGDATGRGEPHELLNFMDWMAKQDFKHKIFVPGNHDCGCESAPAYYRQEAAARNIHLLMEDEVVIDGVKFWGSPATPWFMDWSFNYRISEELAKQYGETLWIGDIWKLIPTDTNVLITHGPPYGILDELVYPSGMPKGVFAGCQELLSVVKGIKPDLHFFGHIHCGHGEKHVDGTSFYNVAICDEMYSPSQPITVVDYIR